MLAYFWGLPFFIRVVLGLVVAIVLLIILVRFRNGKGSAKDSLTILREKLQRGEISEEDYKRARKKRGK
ncbi:MAG TPA: SHOCT domain-containing protein [Bacillota bacterium]|nr:SHOCT domain-containing protein [Bacillota bacterium]